MPADYQPRFLSLHTHVDVRIPEDEDGANKQKPGQVPPRVASKFIVFGGYGAAVLISQQGHDTCLPARPASARLSDSGADS